MAALTTNDPFLFCIGAGEENFTGTATGSLKGFLKALATVDSEALDFHNGRGDLVSWAQFSLLDAKLHKQLKAISMSKAKGRALRDNLVEKVKKRFAEASGQVHADTKLV